MFFLKKKLEISSSHSLQLDYDSKCQNTHGHNWIITIYCKSQTLDENGMVTDFTKIKEKVMALDHANLNDIFLNNPTAENIAQYLCSIIPNCFRVDVQESSGNEVTYEL